MAVEIISWSISTNKYYRTRGSPVGRASDWATKACLGEVLFRVVVACNLTLVCMFSVEKGRFVVVECHAARALHNAFIKISSMLACLGMDF